MESWSTVSGTLDGEALWQAARLLRRAGFEQEAELAESDAFV